MSFKKFIKNFLLKKLVNNKNFITNVSAEIHLPVELSAAFSEKMNKIEIKYERIKNMLKNIIKSCHRCAWTTIGFA